MRRLLLILLALPLLAAGPEPGVVIDLPLTDPQLVKLRASGAQTARMFAFSTTNRPSDFDGAVARLRRAGVEPQFVLVGDPADPPTTRAEIRDFVSFAKAMGRRFEGKVAGWEIWNEQDAPAWWAGMPPVDGRRRDARPYVRLLKPVYRALKRIDRRTPVVMGGLTGNDYRFVRAVYRAGGKGFFDAVATHTDTACGIAPPSSSHRERNGRLGQFTFPAYREVHRVMRRHGDGRKKIWMTELGWSTTDRVCDSGRWAGQKPAGVSEAEQARFLRAAFRRMRRSGIVAKAMVFRLADKPGGGAHDMYGLLRLDGSAKPAFRAFRAYAAPRESR